MSQPKEYIYGPGRPEAKRLSLQAASEKHFLRNLINLVNIQPDQHIIDFGSGGGDVTLMLANRVGPKGRVIGIEIDPERVKISRERAAQSDITNVSYIEGDITQPLKLSIPPADVAWSNYVAGHLGKEGTLHMVKNMKKTVKDNGIIAIHDNVGWTLQSLPNKLSYQLGKIQETLKSSYGINMDTIVQLDIILKKEKIQNIKSFTLRHNEFNGMASSELIENWRMKFSAPRYHEAIEKALGGKQHTDTFTENFLQWMKSKNPHKHIHQETILAVGKK